MGQFKKLRAQKLSFINSPEALVTMAQSLQGYIINIDMQQRVRIALIGDDAGLNETIAMLLQSTGDEKDDFISLASHELKTPVAALKVSSELLEENLTECGGVGNLSILKKLNGR